MKTFQASIRDKDTKAITLGAKGSFFSCTDVTIAKQITDAFSKCTVTCTTQSFSCDGENWWVGKCGSGGEIGIGRAICVGDGTISIRPCINNNNWGGLGPTTSAQNTQDLSIVVYAHNPISGGTLKWSQTLPTGNVDVTSTYCTTMKTFQASIGDKDTKAITLGAKGSFFSCTDVTIAKQITDAFSKCTVTCTTQSFSCDGENWWVGKCGSGGEIGIGRAICVGDGTISIRPCINNNNWGGLGPTTSAQDTQVLSIEITH